VRRIEASSTLGGSGATGRRAGSNSARCTRDHLQGLRETVRLFGLLSRGSRPPAVGSRWRFGVRGPRWPDGPCPGAHAGVVGHRSDTGGESGASAPTWTRAARGPMLVRTRAARRPNPHPREPALPRTQPHISPLRRRV